MSLDVHLTYSRATVQLRGSGVYVRDNGRTRELRHEELADKFPDAIVPVERSTETDEVYWANITHNLTAMARAAGLYEALWRPDEAGLKSAEEMIEPLDSGLRLLQSDPDRFRKFNPENGWGTYESLVDFTARYLAACRAHPQAKVQVSR